MSWAYLWSRMKAVPAGVYAALGAALALFFMYARGRRLEAELAHARLLTEAANAAASSAKTEGKAQVHLAAADEHAKRAELLQKHVITLGNAEVEEQKRIAALPATQVTAEFLKLAQQKRAN